MKSLTSRTRTKNHRSRDAHEDEWKTGKCRDRGRDTEVEEVMQAAVVSFDLSSCRVE